MTSLWLLLASTFEFTTFHPGGFHPGFHHLHIYSLAAFVRISCSIRSSIHAVFLSSFPIQIFNEHVLWPCLLKERTDIISLLKQVPHAEMVCYLKVGCLQKNSILTRKTIEKTIQHKGTWENGWRAPLNYRLFKIKHQLFQQFKSYC